MLDVCYIDAMTEGTVKRVSFGDAVRHYRMLLQLKQGEVARRLGVSQNTVSRWEVSARPPAEFHLVRLAELLRADPEELRQGIIHSEGDNDSVRAEIERFAVQQAQTPEDVQRLVSLMIGAITLDPEGLRRAEDYMRLLLTQYGRDKDDTGAANMV